MFLGLILALIGLLFLLRNLELLPAGVWSAFWPSLLIMIGVYLILLTRRARSSWERLRNGIWRKLE